MNLSHRLRHSLNTTLVGFLAVLLNTLVPHRSDLPFDHGADPCSLTIVG